MKRRRLLILVPAQVLAILLLLELGLRGMGAVHVGVRRRLYALSVPTKYDDARTVEELVSLSPFGFHPRERHNDFVLNSRGLKAPEYERDKPAGTWRAVLLGDSYGFASGGVPYTDLWHQVLERRLAQEHEGPVEVLNLSLRNTHWSIAGNALAGEELLAFLRERGLAP